MKGKVYMLPCPINEEGIADIPARTIAMTHSLDHFIVERARTARRYLKSTAHPKAISDIQIVELDKHGASPEIKPFLRKCQDGISIGVLSEAGCPGIADPGAEIVAMAHDMGITVVPMVGPSSILLALMASGMSGQSFAFNGYLPNKRPQLIQKLRSLESRAIKENQTQIFMDAPYRNEFLLSSCIDALQGQTKLSLAVDIGAETEYIVCRKVKDWNKADLKSFHKRPAIVMIGL